MAYYPHLRRIGLVLLVPLVETTMDWETILLLALIVVLAQLLYDASGGDGGKRGRLPEAI